MSLETVERPRIPYYEQQILSGSPTQLNNYIQDLVKVLQEWVDQITDITNYQLSLTNSDATYWGTIDGNGDWLDGTWRLIKVGDDDFQLQKKISGVFTKNAKWSHNS